MLIPAGPHGGSAECIRALEQEIQRLQELVAVVKNVDDAAVSPNGDTASSVSAGANSEFDKPVQAVQAIRPTDCDPRHRGA
jgi:hypothetical protein